MGPSNVQSVLAGLVSGFGEQAADVQAQNQQLNRQNLLQQAIEKRQEERDQRMAVPKSLYGPLWEATTGQSLPDTAPDTMPRSAAEVLFRQPAFFGRNDAYDRRTDMMKNRPVGGGRGATPDPQKTQPNYQKIDEKANQVALDAAGITVKKGQPIPWSTMTPQQVDNYNTAYQNSLSGGLSPYGQGGKYANYKPLKHTPGDGGFMGFGGTPASVTRQPAPWASASGSSMPPEHAALVKQARAQGQDSATIAAKFNQKGYNYTPADIDKIQ